MLSFLIVIFMFCIFAIVLLLLWRIKELKEEILFWCLDGNTRISVPLDVDDVVSLDDISNSRVSDDLEREDDIEIISSDNTLEGANSFVNNDLDYRAGCSVYKFKEDKYSKESNGDKEFINDVDYDKLNILLGLVPIDDEGGKNMEPYTKNVLSEIPKAISPIYIDDDISDDNFNLNDFVKSSYGVKELHTEVKEDSLDFLGDLSKRLSKAVAPQTIELTEYEKKQEDSAIISYKELLRVHDEGCDNKKIEEEMADFIKELKDIRDNLE